jgi:hypothetical protein
MKDSTMLRARYEDQPRGAGWSASAATDTAAATPNRTEPRSTAAAPGLQAAPSPATDARPNAAIAAAGAKAAPSPATARDSIRGLTVADCLQPEQSQHGPSCRPRVSSHPSIADRLKPARIVLGLGRRPRGGSHLTLADCLKPNQMRPGLSCRVQMNPTPPSLLTA